MKIDRKIIDVDEDKTVLTHMIVSTPFLKEVMGVVDPLLFRSKYIQRVARWVIDFFENMKEAPGKAVEDIYRKNKMALEEEEAEAIGGFLTYLSRDWERQRVNNVKYSVGQAIDFFKLRSLDILGQKILETVSSGDHAEGERLISQYKRVEQVQGVGVDLLRDTDAVIRAFQSEEENLFQFPGELGNYMGHFKRGEFVSFLAPQKRGKTWWLIFSAIRSMLMGHKTLFISLEMTKEQMIRRMWQALLGEPLKGGDIEIPTFEEGLEGVYDVRKKTVYKKGMDLSKTKEQQMKYKRASRTGDIRLLTYPSAGVTVSHIETELASLEYFEKFVPDTIVIDYADLLKAENGRMEVRHTLDEIWKRLRGLAQQKNILMITASQSNKMTFGKDIKAEDASEDSRKLGHVTRMIAINQSPADKDMGLVRLQNLLQREGQMNSSQIVVLYDYGIGRTYLDAALRKDVNLPEK